MTASDTDEHAALLAALGRLREARGARQLAAATGVPGLVWTVMLLGGAMTVVSGSFLAAPNARQHMAMSATLAASGGLVVVMVIALNQPFRGDLRDLGATVRAAARRGFGAAGRPCARGLAP